MGILFGDNIVKIDFINHLDQTAFVYEGMQKSVMEMTREELENAYLLMHDLANFWKIAYDNEVKENELMKKLSEKQDKYMKLLETGNKLIK